VWYEAFLASVAAAASKIGDLNRGGVATYLSVALVYVHSLFDKWLLEVVYSLEKLLLIITTVFGILALQLVALRSAVLSFFLCHFSESGSVHQCSVYCSTYSRYPEIQILKICSEMTTSTTQHARCFYRHFVTSLNLRDSSLSCSYNKQGKLPRELDINGANMVLFPCRITSFELWCQISLVIRCGGASDHKRRAEDTDANLSNARDSGRNNWRFSHGRLHSRSHSFSERCCSRYR